MAGVVTTLRKSAKNSVPKLIDYTTYIYIYIPSKTPLVYLRFWYRKYDKLEVSAIFSLDELNQYFHYPVGSTAVFNFLKSDVSSNDDRRETNCL